MLKIRRPLGRLIFNMGIAIPGKTVFFIETAPCFWQSSHQIFLLQLRAPKDWDGVTHICVNNLTIIGSDNGLSPGRCQAIIRTNARILLIGPLGPLGTNYSESLIKIHTFSFMKMHLKISAKWRPVCLGLNVIKTLIHLSWIAEINFPSCKHPLAHLWLLRPSEITSHTLLSHLVIYFEMTGSLACMLSQIDLKPISITVFPSSLKFDINFWHLEDTQVDHINFQFWK